MKLLIKLDKKLGTSKYDYTEPGLDKLEYLFNDLKKWKGQWAILRNFFKKEHFQNFSQWIS